jgi:hypothetical protein
VTMSLFAYYDHASSVYINHLSTQLWDGYTTLARFCVLGDVSEPEGIRVSTVQWMSVRSPVDLKQGFIRALYVLCSGGQSQRTGQSDVTSSLRYMWRGSVCSYIVGRREVGRVTRCNLDPSYGLCSQRPLQDTRCSQQVYL